MAEFPTFKGSWPWPWPCIGSYCIPYHASLVDLYLRTKFHRNRRNFLWTDGLTYGRADGHLRPTLLGQLRGVDLRFIKFDSRSLSKRALDILLALLRVTVGSGGRRQHRTRRRIVWNATIQHSARSGQLSVHKLFIFYIRQCLVSSVCDWVLPELSAVLLIFSFQFSLLFFRVRQPGSTAAYVVYRTSDVAEKVCSPFLYRAYNQGNDFELMLTVIMKTRHLVEGSFGSEFSEICNRCVVITAWNREMLKCCEEFLRSFGKRPLTLKFSKLCLESFHRETDRRCCVQIS